MNIGQKVIMLEIHPWEGREGTYIGLETIHGAGMMHMIELDNGAKCPARDDEFQAINQ